MKYLRVILLFSPAFCFGQVVDLYTASELAEMKRQLAAKKQSFAGLDLKTYSDHYTLLAFRAGTGSSELHEHEADIFFITDGEAEMLLGGKMIGGHITKPGELRGTSIAGGERRSLKTGDVIHIPAGVPHQMLLSPGKTITYFVVKVSGQ